MTDKKSLVVPLAIAAANAPVAPAATAPKVLRVVARTEGPLKGAWESESASPVSVTSQGLASVVHVIGGAG